MDGWMDGLMVDMYLTIRLNYETTYYMGIHCLHCIILPLTPTYSYLRSFT
jgi:hypothetical protein